MSLLSYPKISIVTTNFNGGEFLERAIQSVISQQYPNLEYIIIDGKSTDNSVDLIRKYESQITYWVSEPDGGMYEGLQKGLSKSTGDIMAWLNSDDLYHPGALFRIAEFFSEFPQIKWLTGVPTALDEKDNTIIPVCHDYPVWSKTRFYSFDYKWIQQESTFWKRELWITAGSTLNTSLKYAGDFELWLRFFRYERLYSAPVLVGGFRLRRDGQQSVVHLGKYMKEARTCLLKELKKIPISDFFLIPFNYLDRILISIPGVKKIYHASGLRKLMGYPGKFVFNPRTQKFELK